MAAGKTGSDYIGTSSATKTQRQKMSRLSPRLPIPLATLAVASSSCTLAPGDGAETRLRRALRFCRAGIRAEKRPDSKVHPEDFNRPLGPSVAFMSRRKSFPPQSNSYRVKGPSGLCFEGFADGTLGALARTDEVARNGALQRITSARGFLGRPLQFLLHGKQPSHPSLHQVSLEPVTPEPPARPHQSQPDAEVEPRRPV